VGALKSASGWPIGQQTSASHRRRRCAGVAALLPRLPHPHSRVANGVAREPSSAASKQRSNWPTWRRGKSTLGIGAQGSGQPYMLSGFSGSFQPCSDCSSFPPFATIVLPIRLSNLPAQMTREGELQAIRAVGMVGSCNIFLMDGRVRPSSCRA
jgi:hypothetical protein